MCGFCPEGYLRYLFPPVICFVTRNLSRQCRCVLHCTVLYSIHQVHRDPFRVPFERFDRRVIDRQWEFVSIYSSRRFSLSLSLSLSLTPPVSQYIGRCTCTGYLLLHLLLLLLRLLLQVTEIHRCFFWSVLYASLRLRLTLFLCMGMLVRLCFYVSVLQSWKFKSWMNSKRLCNLIFMRIGRVILIK